MAYAVAYMRSILGSIPFLVKLYALFFCRYLFFHAGDPFLRASGCFCDIFLVLLIYFCVFLLFHIKKLHRIVEQQVAIK